MCIQVITESHAAVKNNRRDPLYISPSFLPKETFGLCLHVTPSARVFQRISTPSAHYGPLFSSIALITSSLYSLQLFLQTH